MTDSNPSDGLGVTNVQVAIRLWWEPGNHLLHFACAEVFLNDFGDEIIGNAGIRISHISP